MPGGNETTDPGIDDTRNFHKVELWTRDDRIERMLFAGTSLDKARGASRLRPVPPCTAAGCSAMVTRARPMAEGMYRPWGV